MCGSSSQFATCLVSGVSSGLMTMARWVRDATQADLQVREQSIKVLNLLFTHRQKIDLFFRNKGVLGFWGPLPNQVGN